MFVVALLFRVQVCKDKGYCAATLLDTKGPEIRTAMLRNHKAISLVAGQPIIVEAVGAKYTEFEGYKEEGGETRIGLSYDALCSSVKAGNKILLADGSLSIQVEEILSATELRGTVRVQLSVEHWHGMYRTRNSHKVVMLKLKLTYWVRIPNWGESKFPLWCTRIDDGDLPVA